MESATTTPDTATEERDVPGEGNGPEASKGEARDKDRLLRWSDEVHVGDGAAECEKRHDGSCENPEHFHAFIRLPNQLQKEALVEKADAAKARKLRVLRDPESDASVILDVEIEETERLGHADLVEQMLGFDFLKDHLAAMREVGEDEDFEHIEDDRERLRALSLKSDEERPQEEYDELEKHVLAYTEKVNEARENIQRPLRESLEDKGNEELAELIREERVKAIAQEAGEAAWSRWEWYFCTLSIRVPAKVSAPRQRVFADIDALEAAPDEVITALEVAFREIEAGAGRSLQNATD